MGATTGISWTDKTWNPWRGCQKVSPGCARCYMFTDQRRYGNDPSVVVRTKTWRDPIKWQKAAAQDGRREMIFTCSWSDWFHEDADPWREDAWGVIRQTPNLIYQILTKRDGNIIERLPSDWNGGYDNVWLGVSVEDRKYGLPRIDTLRDIPANIRFLSIEPLLEDIGTVDLRGIHWCIIGGESGHGARPCKIEWIRSVMEQCQAAGVPVFVKQVGSNPWLELGELEQMRSKPGYTPLRDRKGESMREWPEDIRVRQTPEVVAV